MSGFGGAIKLTGESQYRAALTRISQNLREVGSQMKVVSSQYGKSDNSQAALTERTQVLNNKLSAQKEKLSVLNAQYRAMSAQYAENNTKHKTLVASYEAEKQKLAQIEATLGKTSPEYQAQSKVVAGLAHDVDKSSSAVNDNEIAMSKLRTQMNNAKADINKTSGEISELGTQMEKLNGSQNRTVSEMEKLGSTIEQQKSKLAGLKGEYANAVLTYGKNSAEAKNLGAQLKSLSSELQENQAKMDAANSRADNLAGGLDKLGESADGAASGGFTVLKGTLANLASNVIQSAVNSIQNLVGDALDSADALKKFESTMSFAGYDSAQINKARGAMKDYADKTVYDLNTISNTTAQLAANGIQDYNGLTEAAGNLNAVAGGNADTFRSVAMVLTQTAGAGKLTTENWNQLSDAIPGASGKIQEALLKNGAYTGNFRDAMEKGQITADEFNKAIMDLGFTSAAKEAATSTDTFEGAMGNMQAAVTDGLMKIYDAIGSENVTGFINGITNAVAVVIPPIRASVQWFIANLPKIAPYLAAIAAGLGTLMVAQQIDTMVGAFRAWKTATEGLTVAQRLLNAAQLSSPIGLVLAAVAALAAGLVALWNTNDGFRNAVTSAWQSVTGFVGNAVNSIIGFFGNLGNTISQLPSMFATWLQNVISTVTAWVSGMGAKAAEAGSQFVSNVGNFMANLPYNIGYILGTVIGSVISWVRQMASNAASAGSQFVSNVGNFFRNLPGNIANFLTSAISNVSAWVSNMAGKARQAGSQFVSNVVSFLRQLPARVGSFLSQVISRLASWAGQMASKGADGARRMFNAVVNGISSLPSRVAHIGGDIVRGIWNGISGAAGWLAGKVKSFASGILDGMKHALGIHSPSRLFRDEVGKYIAQGVGVGFEDEMGNVSKRMIDAMPPTDAFAQTYDLGTVSAAQASSNGYGYGAQTNIVDAIVEALQNVRVVLDDEVAGRFVTKTVTAAIYR